MTSEEQARELLARIKAFGARGEQSSRYGPAQQRADQLAAILSALRTREAETWEQAAQVADEYAAKNSAFFRNGRTRHEYSEVDAAQREAEAIAQALRARAAQPQEPTT